MRGSVKCGLFVLPATLALFFGLFFGLNYPEIVRHGWPLTKCQILNSKIDDKFCCETQCHHGCSEAPSGSPSCSSQVSLGNSFDPGQCAANSSACPSVVGQPCDDGYLCCNTCCSTCTSCTTSCSGSPPSCSSSCSSYTCDCWCCSSVNHHFCTVACPICYFVDVNVTFYAGRLRNDPHNATYHQEFGKNKVKAEDFYQSHLANSTVACYYNPKALSQVMFDVSFTPWKWAITSIFGILPLFANLAIFFSVYCLIPAWRIARIYVNEFLERRAQAIARNEITHLKDDEKKRIMKLLVSLWE